MYYRLDGARGRCYSRRLQLQLRDCEIPPPPARAPPPQGYWRLNEGSGTTTAVDCSYSSADAAYSNSTTPGGYR